MQPWTITFRKLAANVSVVDQGQKRHHPLGLNQNTLEKMPSFSVKGLKSSVDLQRVREISHERILWRKLIANIYGC